MVSSFDQHSMCANVERITTKTGCTSCTNWTISFKVRGFQTKTHLFQRPFMCANWTTETVVSHHVQTWLIANITKKPPMVQYIKGSIHYYTSLVSYIAYDRFLGRNHGASSLLNGIVGSVFTVNGGI